MKPPIQLLTTAALAMLVSFSGAQAQIANFENPGSILVEPKVSVGCQLDPANSQFRSSLQLTDRNGTKLNQDNTYALDRNGRINVSGQIFSTSDACLGVFNRHACIMATVFITNQRSAVVVNTTYRNLANPGAVYRTIKTCEQIMR